MSEGTVPSSSRTRVANITAGDEFDVYIGRPGKGQDGFFGNPHEIGLCLTCSGAGSPTAAVYHTRLGAIDAFCKYFAQQLEDPTYRTRVLKLRGLRLGCFCRPRLCHGDIIAAWLDDPKLHLADGLAPPKAG